MQNDLSVASDFSYSFKPSVKVQVLAKRALELFPGCYATGDTAVLEARRDELARAVQTDDLKQFRSIVKRCDGAYWGWVSNGQRFFCFSNLWGCVKAYVATVARNEFVIFESFTDASAIVGLSTTPRKMATYCTFSYMPGNDTLFEGVRDLPPATLYELCGTEWKTHGKNDTFLGKPEQMDLEEASHLIAEEIHQSVGRCLEGVDRFMLMLSGGFDSRTILSAALEHRSASDIETFTFGFPGSFDYEIGNKVARAAGTSHHSAPIEIGDYALEDVRAAARDCGGQLFSSVEMPIKLADRIRSAALPVITGFMGDALSGKRLEDEFLAKTNIDGWQEELFDYEAMIPPEDVMPLFKGVDIDARELREYLVDRYMTMEPFEGYADYANLHDQWDYYNRQRNHDFFANSKTSTAGTLYRYPIIAYEVTQAYKRIPNEHRCHGMVYRKAVSERYPKLFAMPMTSYHGGKVRWRRCSRTRHCLNAILFAIRHRILKGRFDLDSNVSYLPFWKYFNEGWEVIRFVLQQEQRYPFLDFAQIRRDVAFLKKHTFYPHRKGPQYARVLAAINLVVGLDTLDVAVLCQ